MPDRLPLPGPSFLKERELRIGERAYRLGMARPTDGPDGWWLAILWVADDEAVIPFRDVAPAAGPPPDPPLARLGPAVSGALSGLILEDAGRLQMRLATVVPADDPARPWRVPLAVRAAFRFEPARAATMGANELAETVQAAFARRSRACTGPDRGSGYAPPCMRDLFDDFMDELRRREAEARGEDPDAVAPRRRRPSEPAPEPDGDGDGDGDGADDHDPEGDGPDGGCSGSGGQPPRPIRGRKPAVRTTAVASVRAFAALVARLGSAWRRSSSWR